MILRTLSLLLLALPAHAADFLTLEGHGGPVKSIDVSDTHVVTASFDYSVGFWSLDGGEVRWLEGHRAGVNTVLHITGNRVASGGDDFAVRLWDLRTGVSAEFAGHQGKVMDLAVSKERDLLASASWDGTIRFWSLLAGTEEGVIDGHDGNVNAVVFASGGDALYSASYDGTIREWDVDTLSEKRVLARHGFGINTLLIDEAAGWLAYGALDGGTRILDLETGAQLADLTLDRRPILAMARSPDGNSIAVGDGEGYIMVVETDGWTVERDFRAARRGPVWALAYDPTQARVFAAGIDDAAYAWPLESDTGFQMGTTERSFLEDPATMENGERQFNRKCSICHTLTPDGARRAGPSLHGLFGRRAGTLEGYKYSSALLDADFEWTDETVDKLFEIGPDHFTPGSKMPMQRIAKREDRADLIRFLRQATGEHAQ